jgi:hypothetical protein
MGRLKCLLLAGALAVAVAAMVAGPASAAKGGNRATAHACQHGGHKTLFEAQTGQPFKNTGDCASQGARGGTLGQFAGQAACVGIGGRLPFPRESRRACGNVCAPGASKRRGPRRAVERVCRRRRPKRLLCFPPARPAGHPYLHML